MSDLVIVYVDIGTVKPNPWNPNVMDDVMFRKTIESIHQFGFVDPVTARKDGDEYQVIDGEHRWKAGQDHSGDCQPEADPPYHTGMVKLPLILLDVDDDSARELTVILNETRGRPDPNKLADLVRSLAERKSTLELERVLPLRRQQLAAMVADRRGSIDWNRLEPEPKPEKERWVERVFRMPTSAASVLDEALVKVKTDEEISDDWKALELICADFVAG